MLDIIKFIIEVYISFKEEEIFGWGWKILWRSWNLSIF